MRVLFNMPSSVFHRCFTQRDLDRLVTGYDLVVPDDTVGVHDVESFAAHHWQDCHVLITGWDTPPVTDASLDMADQLTLWIHAAGSVKHLLPSSFWDRQIALTSCRDALAVGVAETALGMTLAGVKRFFDASRLTQSGGWKEDIWASSLGVRELFDLRIGVVGASCVGRHYIRLLKNFEVDIAVYDPCLSQDDADQLGVELSSLNELMETCDVVSLHAPALPVTRHMIAARQLSSMKDGALLINTARGSLIDEQALIAELQIGRISAFLDVTDPEPPIADSPLRSLPNCIITPHIAGAVANGCFRVGRSAVDQLLSFTRDGSLVGHITKQTLINLG